MRSALTLALGAALVAALLFLVGATASAASLTPPEQDVPAAPAATDAVAVSVSANTGFTRTFQWDIAKAASANPVQLLAGQSDSISYTVSGSREILLSGFYITGTVLVQNPNPAAATVEQITVTLAGPNIGNVPATCPGPLPIVVDGGASLECSFRSPLPGSNSYPTTTVTVRSDGTEIDVAVTKPVPGDRIINEVGYNVIHVLDSYAGSLGVVAGSANPLTFTLPYSRPVSCPTDSGDYFDGLREVPLENTATISETGQIAVADVLLECYAPAVSQQVAGTFDRTWSWGIDKSADRTDGSVSQGQALPINYSVNVTNTSADGDYAISGVISITNNHPSDAMSVNVGGAVTGLPVTLQCPAVLNVPAAGTATCAFSADSVPDATPRQSVATVTFAGSDYVSSEPVTFTANEVDECVGVFDDEGTPGSETNLGTLCRDEAPSTFNYTASPVFNTCGAQQFVNIARLAGSDTAQLGSDSWTVDVAVACGPDAQQAILLPLIFRNAQ